MRDTSPIKWSISGLQPPEPQITRDELFLARAIAFLSAERHKISEPAKYASAVGMHFVDEARRVLTALNADRK